MQTEAEEYVESEETKKFYETYNQEVQKATSPQFEYNQKVLVGSVPPRPIPNGNGNR